MCSFRKLHPFSKGEFQVRLHGGLDEAYGSGEQGPDPHMEGLRDEKLSLQKKFFLNIFFGTVAKLRKSPRGRGVVGVCALAQDTVHGLDVLHTSSPGSF